MIESNQIGKNAMAIPSLIGIGFGVVAPALIGLTLGTLDSRCSEFAKEFLTALPWNAGMSSFLCVLRVCNLGYRDELDLCLALLAPVYLQFGAAVFNNING